MKLHRRTKIVLKENDCNFRIYNYLPNAFPIKNGLKHGAALSPLLFQFDSDLTNAITKDQKDKKELILILTHQLLVYAGDVHLLREKTNGSK
jgi:hypothetical protein